MTHFNKQTVRHKLYQKVEIIHYMTSERLKITMVCKSITTTCTYNPLYTYYQPHRLCKSKVCDSYESYSGKRGSTNFRSFAILANLKNTNPDK
jgi:hypothetical protein